MELTENGNFRLLLQTGKMEPANFRLFSANAKRTIVFFSRQTINGSRRLLFSAHVPIGDKYIVIHFFYSQQKQASSALFR